MKVNLTMVAPARRYHVALTDPVPAGLEAINPKVTTRAGRGRYTWNPPWFDHQNLRDERAEAFTTSLDGGVYTYSYETRATTVGSFVVPPAKAEEMYHPETFGRSATDRVDVR